MQQKAQNGKLGPATWIYKTDTQDNEHLYRIEQARISNRIKKYLFGLVAQHLRNFEVGHRLVLAKRRAHNGAHAGDVRARHAIQLMIETTVQKLTNMSKHEPHRTSRNELNRLPSSLVEMDGEHW